MLWAGCYERGCVGRVPPLGEGVAAWVCGHARTGVRVVDVQGDLGRQEYLARRWG